MNAASPAPDERLLPAPETRAGEAPGFDPGKIAAYYAFPRQYDATGTVIALVSLYGGFRRSDLDTFFSAMGLPVPAIDVIGVDGAVNNPVADPDANAELVMSLELLGSLAPGARLAVYLAPNNEGGLIDGIKAATFGTSPQTDVLCLPWCVAEEQMYPMLSDLLGDCVTDAFVQGLPVCAPAGFWSDGRLHPTVPGSHPFVLACGATRAVPGRGGLAERPITNDPGSPSASTLWPMERWQTGTIRNRKAAARGRLVPDVGALADPAIGYRCYINGQWGSVSAPLAPACVWAALLARVHQALGRPWGMVGDLYSTLGPAGALKPVPAAGAGARQRPTWNSGTGWGAPDGERFLAALRRPAR